MAYPGAAAFSGSYGYSATPNTSPSGAMCRTSLITLVVVVICGYTDHELVLIMYITLRIVNKKVIGQKRRLFSRIPVSARNLFGKPLQTKSNEQYEDYLLGSVVRCLPARQHVVCVWAWVAVPVLLNRYVRAIVDTVGRTGRSGLWLLTGTRMGLLIINLHINYSQENMKWRSCKLLRKYPISHSVGRFFFIHCGPSATFI